MKPLFGKTFDLNWDGKVGPKEELFGYMMMRKKQEEAREKEQAGRLPGDGVKMQGDNKSIEYNSRDK